MTEQEIALANAKGLETRRRRWEQRNEKKRLAALAAEEAARAARRADEAFMKEAVRQAKKAAAIGDVPIGCVIVKEGRIISRGYNRRNADKTVLSHAEITAIKRACKKEGDWRLEDCTLYVTLEPCPMCAGAILQARIPQVFFGARDPKGGAMGGVLDLFWEDFNHRPQVVAGLLESECSQLLEEFFRTLRKGREQTETGRE